MHWQRRFALLIAALGLAWTAGAAIAQSPTPTPTPQLLSGDRVISGEVFTLRQGETLRGSILLYSGEVSIARDAEVLGNIVLFGGRLSVDGRVTGNVIMLGGEATLSDTAVIAGQLTRLGGALNQAPGARILGSTFALPFARGKPASEETPTPMMTFGRGFAPPNPLVFVGAALLGIVTISLLAVVVSALAPENLARAVQAIAVNPWLALGIGALAVVFVPAAILGFAVTLVLIPVALVLALIYALAIVLGWIVSAALLGERLARALKGEGWAPAAQVGLGALVLAVLGNTPFIGGLIGFLAAALGLGALILTRAGTRIYTPPAPAAPLPTPTAPPSS